MPRRLRQQQAEAGAAQQQVIEMQHHFRLGGERQFGPERFAGTHAVRSEGVHQPLEADQVASVATGQAASLAAAEPVDERAFAGAEHRRAIVRDRAPEQRRAGL